MFSVTHVELELCDDLRHRQCLARLSITLDSCFVIHDLRLIQAHSSLFVAMPDRKLKVQCRHCGTSHDCDDHYCRHCGEEAAVPPLDDKIHTDIAHPLNRSCRAMIHEAVVAAYVRQLLYQLRCYRRFVRPASRLKNRCVA